MSYALNMDKVRRGVEFEHLMVKYLQLDPAQSLQFDQVYHWSDWPYNGGTTDAGIDIVARNRRDGSWTAVQVKFYQEHAWLPKSELDKFFERSGRRFTTENGPTTFANRLVISTTDNWSANAEAMLADQTIPVARIGLADIAESPMNWDIATQPAGVLIRPELKETFSPRLHQQEAIDKVMHGFTTHDRGQLIMACGTGKTFTSLRLTETLAAQHGDRATVLFLVPSISLLSQSLREWAAQTNLTMRTIAVCSDTKVSKAAEDIADYDVGIPVSTDGTLIAEQMAQFGHAAGLTVVFSTYQSLPAVYEAQQCGAAGFDLVICDEAHRTTGVTLAGEDPSNFTRIHDPEYIQAAKRLYMTATPRLFDDVVKGKAEEYSAELASMDDEAVFGPELHRLGFGEAVEKGLLTDYKVVVMTVDEQVTASSLSAQMYSNPGEELTLDLASTMIGAWNALAKRSGKEQDTRTGFGSTEPPMQRAVAFAQNIRTSEQIVEAFPRIIHAYTTDLASRNPDLEYVDTRNLDVQVAAKHVDGSMNALTRNAALSWLKADPAPQEVKVLSNARCLSEGVDVPALDAVIFFNPRNSMVDVVQSVGRVMRKSPGKDYGYIILPVAIRPGVPPAEALNDSKQFRVVWQVLNALRAHDDRFNAIINSIDLNNGDISDIPMEIDHTGRLESDRYDAGEIETQQVLFSLKQWQEAIYTKLVDKVGTRTYWEDWADDVAEIAQAQILRINALLDHASPAIREEFDTFVSGLRANLNDSITEDEAISMLSQHLITAPVFDALFAEHDFVSQNPVAQVMTRMANALADRDLDAETVPLEQFYRSVRIRASQVTSASGKQTVIKELYERFFRKAFRKQADALGIVYTPIEIIDFMLRAADTLSQQHFGKGLTDENVHILDPFTGTGTFMVRLLQSGLIDPHDLARKYASELHATEVMLLAYYVAAVNIETTYHALVQDQHHRAGQTDAVVAYEPFEGIALADTFQTTEDKNTLDGDPFKANNARIERQNHAPIHVVIGNPPYSVGQTSANDLNANLKYPALDARIEDTYAAKSTATNKNSLYDSYFRGFRWATDRIGDRGIVAFVTNGGWLTSTTGDGVRLSFAEDFNEIHVFNLRGNQRTAGELSRKEGGKVFGSGSRATVAITIGVKIPGTTGCNIYYRDIGDYLSAEEKLHILEHATIGDETWETITPNTYGDWLNQRSDHFHTWPVLGDKKGVETSFFNIFGAGLKTARDAWCYNFNGADVLDNMSRLIETYNAARADFRAWAQEQGSTAPKETDVNKFLTQQPHYGDRTKISWNRSLKNLLATDTEIELDESRLYRSLYRPFTQQIVYFDRPVNDMIYQLPRMFPTPAHDNICIGVSSPSLRTPFSVLGFDILPNLGLYMDPVQVFSRFTWEPVEVPEGELDLGALETTTEEPSVYGTPGEVIAGYQRVDNITDDITEIYRAALGSDVSRDDIFHFVYGQLHDPKYRSGYEADLQKMLPHIETPTDRQRFDQLAALGQELLHLHLNYEELEPYPLNVEIKNAFDSDEASIWHVSKMRWAKIKDPETGKSVNDVTKLIYNKHITISGIPEDASRYRLGSRSALEWIIDRYRITKDKHSEILNDPNEWVGKKDNPQYLVDLIGKVVRVSVETMRIADSLVEN
jgi:predicted helicase